jgi:hypothetical protein
MVVSDVMLSGRDVYMYCDVMALFRGREIAKLLEEKPEETFSAAMDAFESAQGNLYNVLTQDWIEELKSHSTPIERLHQYLTTMEDEGQQFRSSFPFYAFCCQEKNAALLKQALSICDETWMVKKLDIPD